MPPVRRLPAGHLLRCLSSLLRELIIEIGVWFITRAVKSLKTQINKGGCSVGCRPGQGPPKPAEALRSGVGGNTRSQHTARCRVVAVVRQLLSLPFRKICVVRPLLRPRATHGTRPLSSPATQSSRAPLASRMSRQHRRFDVPRFRHVCCFQAMVSRYLIRPRQASTPFAKFISFPLCLAIFSCRFDRMSSASVARLVLDDPPITCRLSRVSHLHNRRLGGDTAH